MRQLKSIGKLILTVLLIILLINNFIQLCKRSKKSTYSTVGPVKWAIFSQVHKPPEFLKWLNWHQSLNPDKIWIVVENDQDLNIPQQNNVIVKRTTNLKGGSWGSQLDDRKTANFNQAADKLRKEGIEWMIIVDDDELINGKNIANTLSKYPNDDCLIIKNFEAVFKNIKEINVSQIMLNF
jgi:hypothetical protein